MPSNVTPSNVTPSRAFSFVRTHATSIARAREKRARALRRRTEGRDEKGGARTRSSSSSSADDDGDGDRQVITESHTFEARDDIARRIVVAFMASTAIAFVGNFMGVAERALSVAPESARARGLDLIYPVGGFLRCRDDTKGYTFVYPKAYLADQTMARRNASRAEATRALDPPALRRDGRRSAEEPVAAYGPMNSTGEENVSVIVSAVPRSFDLSVFGDAEAQANWLLANVLAKPGSGKTGTLVDSSSKTVSGSKYYTFEYTIQKGTPGEPGSWFRHNVAVFVTRGSSLFTLVAQVPEEKWDSRREDFFKIADSFRVFVPSG